MEINIIEIVLVYLMVINLIAFALMGIDKWKSKRNKWRIPEKTLFLFPCLGGGIGGLLGMYHFRHKTRHWYFKYGFFALLIIEYGLGIYLLVL